MEDLAVVYISEDEKRGIIDTGDSSKCGEVFRSTSGKYSLCCLHCNHSFLCLTEFSQHIEDHFQLIDIATSNDPDGEWVSNSVKDEITKPSTEVKQEPECRISRINCENNNSHLQKKSTRKKIKHTVEEEEQQCYSVKDNTTKSTKPKASKTSREPSNNMWICDICNKFFSTKNHICQHMKLHRKAPKEHKCYLCGWEFHEKGNLTRHLRTHNNDPKAFTCDICKKGFAQERYLSDHKKIHFPDTSFLCAICGRAFTSSSLLMRHTIIHTGEKKFSCEVCNRAFSRSDKLKEHRIVHTGVKPWTCAWEGCNKSFSAKKSLRFHEYAHSGMKKFKCNYCDLFFMNPAARRSHEKSGHLLC